MRFNTFHSFIALLEIITFESLKTFPQFKLFYSIYIDLIIPLFQVLFFSFIRKLFIVYEMTKINQFNNIFSNFYCNFVQFPMSFLT